ncbi:L-piperidine-6-carboxylate dehydrogenase [Steroidobacter agaridevorans]|uniref:L-piperidine-6-carboxylate dehydrogenase n=1 Tax=Steroidobacter agaridevorans TaxID=2695856 RepID=UPI001321EE15|nr:aldehyde dehydrogenase family protein [Steroidobacter agaridevorans]GFE91603.1 aldehyde dehydrogenase [Steroidobacter agaridevorans]
MTNLTVVQDVAATLSRLGVAAERVSGGSLIARSPISGDIVGRLTECTAQEADEQIERAHQAFVAWRAVPAPKRGELVRLFGEELRAAREDLGRLVTLEAGKILSEGQGEVQEMIDICDYAVGLSRQLFGLTIASERAEHRLMENWHPLGVVGVISAFNFPVAVWAWNATLALVCGNSVVWKPSEKTPLTALAVQTLFERAAAKFGGVPEGLSTLLIGGRAVGEVLVDHPRVPLVSATGSTQMGRTVAPKLAARFARAILELGGNNGAIVSPTADMDLALRAIAFGAMGTAGQRCTTLRRLFVHASVYDDCVSRLKKVYESVAIGDPRRQDVLIGPLVDKQSYQAMQQSLQQASAIGGKIVGGVRVAPELGDDAYYVRPALVEVSSQDDGVRRETFAPILYVMKYENLQEAVRLHNDVPQGLSSCIFTNDLREAEYFLSALGSDCGIANVNIGPSGAEIGGAFGGEKETGGGREAGSDCWKGYMRRATNTVNYGSRLPLAQGVKFDI